MTLGPIALASARIVRIEPTPTARSRTREGSPWMTSRVAAVPPPKNSPFMGEDRSASPVTLAWRMPRLGLNRPRYDWVTAAVGARRPADDAHLVDDHLGAAQ